ncbi:hypothetical protein N7532_003525 [Penicillium argentinense]|uniref:Uncharacterized protein n=1 Tax=Penicillium argentinense TaxID=1131581 RepID=A0A9W9FMJ4_9EURO|nr:uncharacterized protein N7532_003525 [Penicillium argentinense]KAJ5102996.1 hypothetical protein N7532_003525 [Penicillium argentinense]
MQGSPDSNYYWAGLPSSAVRRRYLAAYPSIVLNSSRRTSTRTDKTTVSNSGLGSRPPQATPPTKTGDATSGPPRSPASPTGIITNPLVDSALAADQREEILATSELSLRSACLGAC